MRTCALHMFFITMAMTAVFSFKLYTLIVCMDIMVGEYGLYTQKNVYVLNCGAILRIAYKFHDQSDECGNDVLCLSDISVRGSAVRRQRLRQRRRDPADPTDI